MSKDIWDETNFYGVVDEAVDNYTDEQKDQIKENWLSKYGSRLNLTFFKDRDFVTNFLNSIPEDEQEKYIENTIKYNFGYQTNEEYDSKYVLVARRAVPSYESKPENFWTVEASEVFNGLTAEIANEQRLHSVIMVSTLQSLMDHGRVSTTRGITDGEIAIDPNKNFDQFLFMYKPQHEFYELVSYLKNGGITREELLEQLRATSTERAIRQGLPVKSKIPLASIEATTSSKRTSEINGQVYQLKEQVQERTEETEHTEEGWGQDDDW